MLKNQKNLHIFLNLYIKNKQKMKDIKIVLLLFLTIVSLSTQMQFAQQLLNQQNEIQSQQQRIYESNVKSYSMRLTPNQDIMTQITKLFSNSKYRNKISALSIASAVGSVNYCWLRLANQSTLSKVKGPMQIVSLSGTFDLNLQPHVHIALSTNIGQTIGGHLPSLQERQQAVKNHYQPSQIQQNKSQTPFGCPIFTTLQLVLLSHQNIVFQRKVDPVTTFHELTIRKKHFYSK